jgi:FkbM family methyltransferase
MSSLLFNGNGWTVDCLTLESFFKTNNITDCNFIKIDVEGGEELIIRSSIEFIKNNDFTIYIALHIPWIKDKKQFFDNLIKSFSNYKYI